MHEVLINRLGGLSLPRKSVVRLTDLPDMTLDVYRGCKTTIQQPFDALASRPGGLGPPGVWGSPQARKKLADREVNNTAGGSMRLVLTYFDPEPPVLQRYGSIGVRRALTCFVQKVKITAGAWVGVRPITNVLSQNPQSVYYS